MPGQRWADPVSPFKGYRTMTLRPRPVFLCVADPILCLDLESALTGAGYQVLRGAPDQALPDGPVALALVDRQHRRQIFRRRRAMRHRTGEGSDEQVQPGTIDNQTTHWSLHG
jgi:hypothetical protein